MAKDTGNVLDDQDDGVEEQERPQTLRETLKASFDEHREDSDEPKEREPKGDSKEEISEDNKPASKRAREKSPDEQDVKPKRAKDITERTEELSDDNKGQKKEEVKEDPKDIPPFYRQKGKATWDKLSPEDKQTIITREREVSDGFAQVSQRIRAIEDIERVISPRIPMIQKLGISPVETVSRLFQWMDALQGPNRLQAFKDLAGSLGVNPSQFATQANATQTEETQTDGPPPWFSEFTGVVDQKLSKVEQIERQLANQQQVAAANAVSSWAKDKPYYQQVAPLMGQLLESGIVGLNEDGSVDLDGAYEKAIKLDPNVAALIQQEAATKSAEAAKEAAQKEAKEKSEKLARARRAGSGLRPAPASGPSVLPSASRALNGKKDTSVRGSIRAALQELSE